MNLVIIHYHLNRGGVTSVIRNQINSLSSESSITNFLVLHGPGDTGWPGRLDEATNPSENQAGLQFQEIEELGYQPENSLLDSLSPKLLDAIVRRGFEPTETLIQIHNHNLGKNNALMVAMAKLAESGFRLLLQIHDFAEDMRPGNYVAIQKFCQEFAFLPNELIFPQQPNIHFAFLNHRDLGLVRGRFVPDDRCHLLPNPVSTQPFQQDSLEDDQLEAQASLVEEVRTELGCEGQDQLVVYPVRAIRRKNAAEAALFAAANSNVRVAITLPAVTEVELSQYKNLKQVVAAHGIPVSFEAGQQGLDFVDLIQAANFIFTSSVAEGFGMVFLESWCWGKQLIGRNLASITQDFVESGLRLGSLYENVKIPMAWIKLDKEQEEQQKLFDQVLSQFGLSAGKKLQLSDELESNGIDFAKLRHRTQLSIVADVWQCDEKKQELLNLNPKFKIPELDASLVQANAHVVAEKYTTDSFRHRFFQIVDRIFDTKIEYESELEFPGSQHQLVESFLDPENFFPIRVEIE